LLEKVACKNGKSCNIKFLQPAQRTTKFLSISGVEKLALLITPEDKSNKQQNQAVHSFSLTSKPKLFHRSDLLQSKDEVIKNTFQSSCDKLSASVCALSVVLSI